MPPKTLAAGLACALLALLIIPAPLRAGSGTEGASFLDIPVGGRPAALAGAYSAAATDAYAPIHNPAGLGLLERQELAGMHLQYLESIQYEFAGLAWAPKVGHALGLAAQVMRPGDLEGRDLEGNPIGDVSGWYGAFSLAYGQEVGERLALGATGKWIRGEIGGYSAQTWGADLGALVTVTERLSLAAVAANLGGRLTFLEDGDPLPTRYKAGAAWWALPRLQLLAQGEFARAGRPVGRFGAEWQPAGRFAVRGGYRTDTTRELSALAGVTAGVGLLFRNLQLDYAWVPLDELGTSHYASIMLRWGAPMTRRRWVRFARRRDAFPSGEIPGGYDFNEFELPPAYQVPRWPPPVSAVPADGPRGDLQ